MGTMIEGTTRLLGPPVSSHTSSQGSVVVWRPAPGVSFGVRAANVVLRGHLTVYNDAETFDRELRRVVAKEAARSPSGPPWK